MDTYYSKYIKYKQKYLKLSSDLQKGGANAHVPVANAPVANAPVANAPVVYNPNRNVAQYQPPINMPATQSIFYMPIIAEAYYISSGIAVPQNILDAGGRIIALPNITPVVYNQMVQDIVAYLNQGNNLQILDGQFNGDRRPLNNEGHIPGNAQELLLASVTSTAPHIIYGANITIQVYLEDSIGRHYSQ